MGQSFVAEHMLNVTPGGGGGVTDHGALTGLTPDDDHPHYLLRAILTTKGDLYVRDATGITRIAIGTNGQVLTADSAEVTGAKWATPATVVTDHGLLTGLADDDHLQYVLRNILTTKGDLFIRDATGITRITVGTDGQVLTADSAMGLGAKWATPATGVTDHGALTGLSDDDHLQYVLRNILTTKGDLYVRNATDVIRIAVGTDGQVLTADSAMAAGTKWATPATGVTDHGALTGLLDDDHTQYVLRNILTTKGDLFARSATDVSRLAVGTNGQVLTADSAEATGAKWATPSGGGGGVGHADILMMMGA